MLDSVPKQAAIKRLARRLKLHYGNGESDVLRFGKLLEDFNHMTEDSLCHLDSALSQIYVSARNEGYDEAEKRHAQPPVRRGAGR